MRLNIIPDGGVARLRVYGEVVPDWSKLKPGELVDLAAVENGGVPLVCSDMFFSSMNNLIMPGRSENMGDGWETKRRRGPGYDWIIVKLGSPGAIRKVEVDTNHFKGNYPDMCSIEGCAAPDASTDRPHGNGCGLDARFFPKRNCRPIRDISSSRNLPRSTIAPISG